MHMHTPLSKHASGNVADYRAAAAALGMSEICFTDHAPTANGLGADVTMGFPDMPRYRELVTSLHDQQKPTVLFGIEADYYEGCDKHLSGWIPAQSFDLVLGSVHFIENWAFDDPSQAALSRATFRSSGFRFDRHSSCMTCRFIQLSAVVSKAADSLTAISGEIPARRLRMAERFFREMRRALAASVTVRPRGSR